MSLKDMPVVTVEQIARFREQALFVEQQRDKLLDILKTVSPAIHQLAWIGLVYNDHNFDAGSVARKCQQAMKDSGLGSQFEGVDKYNEWVDSVSMLIAEIESSK